MKKIDLLITNANVLTLDEEGNRAGSVAVTDGRISGIWTEPEPPKQVIDSLRQTEVINLKGATLVPGFIDTHNHILTHAEHRTQVDCSSPRNQNIADIQALIREKARQTPKGEWIIGYGYDDTMLEDHRHPTREDLDSVASEHPVFLRHISGHLSAINSAALERIGIDEEISDPPGGHYGRDETGKLNGVLYEVANNYVRSHLPSPSVEERIALLGEAAQDYMAEGITCSTDAATRSLDEFEAHVQSVARGTNPMRMRLMVMHDLLQEKFEHLSAEEMDTEIYNRSHGRARLDSAKFFQDGSIQGFTGALRKPYHSDSKIYGDLIHDQETLNEKMLALHEKGYRIATHGNGDRAIGSILDAYEYALGKVSRADHRHRIEHVQTATHEDLDRMKRLDVAGSFFINHVYYWGDRHERIFLGPERASQINPLADVIEKDILFTLHSDCPITPISPLFSVWAAVNRVTREGKVLGAEQKCDVETALKSMTIYGAALNFEENEAGSIEIGKRADFAVLEADPTAINPMDIKDISILSTIIDGSVQYQNGLPAHS